MPGIKNTPRLTQKAPFAHLGAPLGHAKVWSCRFIWPKLGTLGACLGEKWPGNGPKRDRIRISATRTGNFVRNSKHTSADPKCPLFAPLGTPLGHAKVWSYRFIWPKPGTAGACSGENGPKRDRIRISTTQAHKRLEKMTQKPSSICIRGLCTYTRVYCMPFIP
jgi:hypothetical protein